MTAHNISDMENKHIDEWKSSTPADKKKLQDYLQRLKRISPINMDAVAKKAHDEVAPKVDCLACGNCCRSTVTDFSTSDIKRVSKHLGVSKKSFIKTYLMQEYDGTYITNNAPCPFLEEDNKCKIYDVRPEVCQSYPHTHRKGFTSRIHAHQANVDMCPISYQVVKSIQSKLKL